MKKILLLAGIFLFLISCEGPQGPPGQDGQANKIIRDYDVHPRDWEGVYNNDNLLLYYRYIFNEPLLTSNIYNNGAILAYREYYDIDGFLVQELLPNVINHEEDDGELWFQTLTFDYNPGSVGFIVRNSNFRESVPDEILYFRVIFVW